MTAAHSLVKAIHEKCQQERWFGPELDRPWYLSAQEGDVFFDEMGAPVTLPEPEQLGVLLSTALHTGFAYPPATPAQIAHAEQLLGFALPPVLKTLYQEVANGGFGPGGGLRGLEGGHSDPSAQGGTLLDYYPTTPQPDQLFDLPPDQPDQQKWFVLPEGCWPRQVLCLADMGCVQAACVETESSQMYLLVVTAEDRLALVRLPWSLEEWLWRWVRGEETLALSSGAA